MITPENDKGRDRESPSQDEESMTDSAFREADNNQNESLFDAYWRFFEDVPADGQLRDEAHRLRYQVYVTERGFEDPNDHPGGLERDAFDEYSAHALLRHKATGRFAGTVRIVLPRQAEGRFPLQSVCHDPLLEDPIRFPPDRIGEVSRFCISKDFRRRVTDDAYPDAVDHHRSAEAEANRRIIPYMMIGLIEALVRMSVENNVTYWCAAMEPQLLRLLKRIGIHFDPIGPTIDYHGLRQPCYKHLPTLLDRVHREQPEVWEVLTMRGTYAEQLRHIDEEFGNG
jgi:N-acyl amino acid synthase of PEP-CTERM/exosortase system